MKIYPGENASGQVSSNRLNDRSLVRGDAQIRNTDTPPTVENPVPEIRKQILVVQRSLGRSQSVLSGFEGFERFLGTKADVEEATIRSGAAEEGGAAAVEELGEEIGDCHQLERQTGAVGQAVHLLEVDRVDIGTLAFDELAGIVEEPLSFTEGVIESDAEDHPVGDPV